MSKFPNLPLILIFAVAILLRLVNLNQSFWLDEAAQVIESARPLSEQLNIAADFHPPGYHLILHFWMRRVDSESWIRLLSVLFGVGSIYILYRLGNTLGGKTVALLSAIFLATSPFHIWYSQEARPYMMFVFFSVLSTYLLIRKKWLWYGLSVIGLLYSVYFSFFLLFGHIAYIAAFEQKKAKIFFGSLSSACLFFLPWIPSLVKQMIIGTGEFFQGWKEVVSVPPAKAVFLTLAKFIFGKGSIDNNYLYAAVTLPFFLIFLCSCFIVWKMREGRILLVLYILPFVTAAILSIFIPILAPQRLIFLLPFFYLILAIGIMKIPNQWRILSIGIILITNITGITQYYLDPSVQREQWRQAVSFVESDADKNSLAVFVFPAPFAPFQWYSRKIIKGIGIAPSFTLQDNDLENFRSQIEDAGVKTVYLFQYLTGLTDPQGITADFLAKNGFREKKVYNFPGVGFIYNFERVALEL